MGFAEPDEGLYLFNAMDSAAPVKSLCTTFLKGMRSGHYELPSILTRRLEAVLEPESIGEIPWD